MSFRGSPVLLLPPPRNTGWELLSSTTNTAGPIKESNLSPSTTKTWTLYLQIKSKSTKKQITNRPQTNSLQTKRGGGEGNSKLLQRKAQTLQALNIEEAKYSGENRFEGDKGTALWPWLERASPGTAEVASPWDGCWFPPESFIREMMEIRFQVIRPWNWGIFFCFI